MRGEFILLPGANLRYSPNMLPGYNEVEKYHGQLAQFVEYKKIFVGPLDMQGRMPGVYADPTTLVVKFSDGAQYSLHATNLKALPGLQVRFDRPLPPGAEDARIGDLPHPIQFWPGDLVKLNKKTPSVEQSVRGASFNSEGALQYDVGEGSVGGDHLDMVKRGNVWALYNDPTKLRFESDEEERSFWASEGISSRLPSGDMDFLQLAVDFFVLFSPGGSRLQPRRLHDCFAQHRERVRSMTKRLYGVEPEEALA